MKHTTEDNKLWFCSKCNGLTEKKYVQNGCHVGAYCKECGKWFYWVPANERRLAEFAGKIDKSIKSSIHSNIEQVPYIDNDDPEYTGEKVDFIIGD